MYFNWNIWQLLPTRRIQEPFRGLAALDIRYLLLKLRARGQANECLWSLSQQSVAWFSRTDYLSLGGPFSWADWVCQDDCPAGITWNESARLRLNLEAVVWIDGPTKEIASNDFTFILILLWFFYYHWFELFSTLFINLYVLFIKLYVL